MCMIAATAADRVGFRMHRLLRQQASPCTICTPAAAPSRPLEARDVPTTSRFASRGGTVYYRHYWSTGSDSFASGRRHPKQLARTGEQRVSTAVSYRRLSLGRTREEGTVLARHTGTQQLQQGTWGEKAKMMWKSCPNPKLALCFIAFIWTHHKRGKTTKKNIAKPEKWKQEEITCSGFDCSIRISSQNVKVGWKVKTQLWS